MQFYRRCAVYLICDLHDFFGVELAHLKGKYLHKEMVFGWGSLQVEILQAALRNVGGGLIHTRSDYITPKGLIDYITVQITNCTQFQIQIPSLSLKNHILEDNVRLVADNK